MELQLEGPPVGFERQQPRIPELDRWECHGSVPERPRAMKLIDIE
jgi:hypothetical protein